MQRYSPDIVISFSDCHAVVCRYRQLADGSVSCERATNAADLEAAALAALATQDQPVLLGTHCACPPQVADQAVWPAVPTEP